MTTEVLDIRPGFSLTVVYYQLLNLKPRIYLVNFLCLKEVHNVATNGWRRPHNFRKFEGPVQTVRAVQSAVLWI
jgi:hypothetical protein